jgi:hypothetical protein
MPSSVVSTHWSRSASGFTVTFPEQVPLQLSHGFLWIGALVVGVTLASIFSGADPTQAMTGDLGEAARFTVLGFVVLPLVLIVLWQQLIEPRLRSNHAVWEIEAGAEDLVVRRDGEEKSRVALAEVRSARFEPGRLVVETAGFPVYVPLHDGLPFAGTDIVEAVQKHLAGR